VSTLTLFLGTRYGAQVQFPAQGDDDTQSPGQFNVIVNPGFQATMAGYPGYNSTNNRLTSPVLYDPNTTIGRSSPLGVNVLIACSNAIVLLTVGGGDKPRGGSAWKVAVGTGGGWGGLEGAGVPVELELAGAQVLQGEHH